MKQFPERPKYQVSSTLPAADRAALERLFFFNENQARLRDSVVRAVEGYGGPKIVRREGMLRLVLPRIENAQTLYFRTNEFNPLLVGVVVYVREERNLKLSSFGRCDRIAPARASLDNTFCLKLSRR